MNNDFKRGMQSVLTIFPKNRESGLTLPTHSDLEALEEDWMQVGKDLWVVLEKIEGTKEHKRRAV